MRSSYPIKSSTVYGFNRALSLFIQFWIGIEEGRGRHRTPLYFAASAVYDVLIMRCSCFKTEIVQFGRSSSLDGSVH